MSKKIVRVFEVKAPQVKPSHLIKSILEADEAPYDERGLVSETNIQHVLDHIFSVPSDSVRCILFLKAADFKSRWLTQGGPQKVADAIDSSIFDRRSSGMGGGLIGDFFKSAGSDFSLMEVTTTAQEGYSHAVLLNVKKQVFAKIQQASSGADRKAAFTACISHDFYVAVLNLNEIRKAKVGPLADHEERLAKFDILKFISAYPIRHVIDSARSEYEARKNGAGDAQADSDDEAVDAVVDRVISYVIKQTKAGKLKSPKAKFEATVHDMLYDAKEFVGREKLIPIATQAVLDHPSTNRLQDVLAFLGSRAAPQPTAAPAEPAKGEKATKEPLMKAAAAGKGSISPDEITDDSDAKELFQKFIDKPALGRRLAALLNADPRTAPK